MKKFFLILLMLFLGIFSQVSAGSKQTQPEFSGNGVLGNNGYELSSSKIILKHGICKEVTKVGMKNLFVPLKTSGEWQSFYTKVPSSVATVGECSCLATSLDGYIVGAIFHGASTTSTKSLPLPLNASSANKTGTFSCNGGVTSLISETSDNITCNAGYSWNGASCVYIPLNCSSGTQNGYTYTGLIHLGNQGVNKTIYGTPSNGKTIFTAIASCNDGSVTISGESSSISCDLGYTWDGSSCIGSAPPPPLPSDCPAGNYFGYHVGIGSMNLQPLPHTHSQGVSKVLSGVPTNGKTNYTATATCNNGNITISGENPTTVCDSGYTWNGASCAMIVAPKCYNVDITYNMTTDYIGTSWSYNGNNRCKSNDFWTMKAITDCSGGTPKIPYSNGSFGSSSCAYTFNQYGDYWGHFSCIEVACP